MATFIPTAVLLLSLAGSFGGAGTSTGMAGGVYGGQQLAAAPQPNSDAFDHAETLLQALQATQNGNPRDRILRTVFVVPGPELASEGIAQITEDLAVMCRIFDKATVWAGRMFPGQTAATIPVDLSGIEISENRVRTQALYLDGYGAVFFLPVDFPLAAPPEEQAPAKTESSGDPVWSQTANELRGAPQGPPRAAAPQYDAQKVENLKAALIGTLRHAANLRTHGANDVINIVVTTRQNQAMGRGELLFQQRGLTAITSTEEQTVAPAPTVLILRATKADVDATVKGGLNPEQFTAKVQILKSWTTPAPVESGMGGFGGGMMGGGGWAPLQTR